MELDAGHKRKKIPQSLFGLDLRPENLPQDIPVEALGLLRAGDPRAALSLLYRGTLAALIQHHQLEIPESATEGECLALIAATGNESEADYIGRLTHLWLQLAYGHRPPEEGGIEKLCAQWQAYFGAGNEPA